jgi:hypothetical protein
MQETDRIGLGVVGAKGVGADQLGEAVRLMRLGHALGAHFVQHDWDAALSDLPGGFGARKPAADHVYGMCCCHGATS